MFLDASDIQLGDHVYQIEAANVDKVLKHDHYPVLLHSRKLNNYDIKCAVTGKELLSAAGSLSEYR